MTKTGWKTTEFWATLATSVGLVLTSVAGVLPPEWAAVAIAVATVAYTVSRGLAKKGA